MGGPLRSGEGTCLQPPPASLYSRKMELPHGLGVISIKQGAALVFLKLCSHLIYWPNQKTNSERCHPRSWVTLGSRGTRRGPMNIPGLSRPPSLTGRCWKQAAVGWRVHLHCQRRRRAGGWVFRDLQGRKTFQDNWRVSQRRREARSPQCVPCASKSPVGSRSPALLHDQEARSWTLALGLAGD